jgi:hypothetical protein
MGNRTFQWISRWRQVLLALAALVVLVVLILWAALHVGGRAG